MSADVSDKIKEILSDVIEIDIGDITESFSSETCEDWDSARHISVILSVEERFGVTFAEDEFLKVLSFVALRDAVLHKLGQA